MSKHIAIELAALASIKDHDDYLYSVSPLAYDGEKAATLAAAAAAECDVVARRGGTRAARRHYAQQRDHFLALAA